MTQSKRYVIGEPVIVGVIAGGGWLTQDAGRMWWLIPLAIVIGAATGYSVYAYARSRYHAGRADLCRELLELTHRLDHDTADPQGFD